MLLTDLSNTHAVRTINKHLQDNIIRNNKQGSRKYELLISSGTAYYDPEIPCSVDKLLYKADNIMYHIKKSKEL